MHIGWTKQPGGFVSIIEKPPKELEDFKLLESWESTGYFWSLKYTSTKLYGRILFKAGHSVKLFLDGTFEPHLHKARGLNFGVIHGQLFNGIRCSIFNTFGYVEVFMAESSYYRTEITGDLLLLGSHYHSKEEIKFSVIDFVCFGLNDWFNYPLQIDYEKNNTDNCTIVFNPDIFSIDISYKSIEFKVYTFCSRTIPFGCSEKGIEFNYQYHLYIEPKNPQGYDWFYDVLVILREFFTFIIGKGAYTLDIKGFFSKNLDEQGKFENEISIFIPVAIPKTLNTDSHYLTTRYNDIKDSIQDVMKYWFSNYDKISVITSTYRKILTLEGESVRNIFMQVVQNLEHFHGVIFPNESRYLPKKKWRRVRDWLSEKLPNDLFVDDDCEGEHSHFLTNLALGRIWHKFLVFLLSPSPDSIKKRAYGFLNSCSVRNRECTHRENNQIRDIIIQRISSLNKLSLRSRLEQIFNSVSRVELMPLMNNPNDSKKAIEDLLRKIEDTRNYYTHYDKKLARKQISKEELEEITSICWSVLTYVLSKRIGFNDKYSGNMAYNSKMAMFLINRQVDL